MADPPVMAEPTPAEPAPVTVETARQTFTSAAVTIRRALEASACEYSSVIGLEPTTSG